MWHIENPKIRKATLDFTSSGQGNIEVSQLVSDNLVLMNALEIMEWNDERTQVLICEACGYESCQSGNWVNLRISGQFVLLIPAFDEMEDDQGRITEYGPPQYLRKQGTPYFDLHKYKSLLELHSTFPTINKIKTLEMREAMRLAQFEMPYCIFGEPPKIELTTQKADLVVAASEGQHKEVLQIINKVLLENYENRSPALIRKRSPEEELVSLFLDGAEFTEWPALVKRGTEFSLLVDEVFVVEDALLSQQS